MITPLAPENPPIIGVICSGDIAIHRDKVKQTLQYGLEQRPDAVWVCIEPKSDRMTHDVMLSLDIEPVVLPMNAAWRRKDADGKAILDLRRTWRDLEMLMLCDELVVFHKAAGNSPWRDRAASGRYAGRLFLVELGEQKAKKSHSKLIPAHA